MLAYSPRPRRRRPQRTKRRSALLSRLRYRIETVISQWCGRLQLKACHARDTWHLSSRLLRAVLCHTLCIFLAYQHGFKPSSSPNSSTNLHIALTINYRAFDRKLFG